MKTPSRFRQFSSSVALGFAGALAVAVPASLHAEDPVEAAAEANQDPVAVNGLRFGDIVAQVDLVRDDKTGKRCFKLVVVNLSSDREQLAQLDLRVNRNENMPMARVEPPPQVAWESSYKVLLPPGERDEKVFILPAKLAKELESLDAERRAAAKLAANKKTAAPTELEMALPPVSTSYWAQVGEWSKRAEPKADTGADGVEAPSGAEAAAG